MDFFNYKRRPTVDVPVGSITMGGNFLVVVQTMTNTDTRDTEGSVAQCERIIAAGADLIRLTTQESVKRITCATSTGSCVRRGMIPSFGRYPLQSPCCPGGGNGGRRCASTRGTSSTSRRPLPNWSTLKRSMHGRWIRFEPKWYPS